MSKAQFRFAKLNLEAPFGKGMLKFDRDPSMGKEQFLEAVFGSSRRFLYEGELHYFEPERPLKIGKQSCVLAKLGRDIERSDISPQKDGFKRETRIVGEFVWVLINCSIAYDESGQFNDIGQLAIYQNLQHYQSSFPEMMNRLIARAATDLTKNPDLTFDPSTPWRPRVKSILEATEFNAVFKNRQSEIRQINFLFDTPNAGRLAEDVKELIKKVKEQTNSDKLELTIYKEPKQEFPNVDIIEDIVSYMNEGGGGRVFVRGTRRKYLYRSDKKEVAKTCEANIPPNDEQEDDFGGQMAEELLREASSKFSR